MTVDEAALRLSLHLFHEPQRDRDAEVRLDQELLELLQRSG
jgi:hypothetical protein